MRSSISQIALLAIPGLMGGALPALAQSMPAEWYGGVLIGRADVKTTIIDDLDNSYSDEERFNLLTGLVGFRAASGNMFYGGEFEVGLGMGADFAQSDGCTEGGWIGVFCSYDWDSRTRGIFGYRSGNIDAFASLGMVAARVGYLNEISDAEKHVLFGWSAGVGVDLKVSDRVKIRGEVLRDNFRDKTFDDGYNGDWSQNTVRAGALFSF